MNVRLEFVKKCFEDKEIFNIKHHDFKDGMIHGIIGANGVGKTTLLRVIAGLDTGYTGQVVFGGSPMNSGFRRRISYMSQRPYMLERTVYDNLSYPLQIRKTKKQDIENRVDDILTIFGLTHLAQKKATVLSAGEREKVNLARGLIFNPDVVLLDEPTASIDPDAVTEIERIIIQYQRRQKATVLVVTHNLSQALRLCDTVHILEDKDLRPVNKDEIIENLKKVNAMEDLLSMDYKILGV